MFSFDKKPVKLISSSFPNNRNHNQCKPVGTSINNYVMNVEDTFASKVSAIQDSTADNSVGNVTGSNAVNVFLGIGVAWSIAAIYHAMHGNQFIVPPGKSVTQ